MKFLAMAFVAFAALGFAGSLAGCDGAQTYSEHPAVQADGGVASAPQAAADHSTRDMLMAGALGYALGHTTSTPAAPAYAPSRTVVVHHYLPTPAPAPSPVAAPPTYRASSSAFSRAPYASSFSPRRR